MLNKKADASIIMLVVLALALSIIALLSFAINSGRINSIISDSEQVEAALLKENLGKFYLQQAGENALAKTYKEFVEENKYLSNLKTNSEGYPEFSSLHPKLNENFKTEFLENFKTEFTSYNLEEVSFKDLQTTVVEINSINLLSTSDAVQLTLNNWKIEDSSKKITVSYTPEITLNFKFENLNLHPFEKILSAKNTCKSRPDIKGCFNTELLNFNTQAEPKIISIVDSYTLITLTSKKQFLTGEKFEPIKFSFIPK